MLGITTCKGKFAFDKKMLHAAKKVLNTAALAGSAKSNQNQMTEKEQYLASIAAKKSKGLKDVKFFTANTFNVTEDQAYGELNRLDAAVDLPDEEVLGKYSLKQ